MTHPDILAVEREGHLREERLPYCPVCDTNDLTDIYFDRSGTLVGCDCCLTWRDAWSVPEVFREE